MSSDLTLSQIKKEWHGSLRSYIIGFISCLILTGISFFLVSTNMFEERTLTYTIAALAVVQATFQLVFFLHLGQEAKPRFETFIFLFMLLILLIIVIGSLWVMNDLNKRVMPHMQHNTKETIHD